MKALKWIASEVGMVTVNIREARKQLSKLVDRAAKGELFVIAKAGKPLVKVSALDAPGKPQRLGSFPARSPCLMISTGWVPA